MTPRSRVRLAWALLALYVMLVAAAIVFATQTAHWPEVAFAGAFVAFPLVGALIASRRAGGPIGWICLGVGLAVALDAALEEYSAYSLRTNPGSLPAGAYAAWLASFSWVGFIGPIGVFFVLLFPDGRLPSRRWRPIPWIAAAAMACAASGMALYPGKLEGAAVKIDNPVGVDAKGVLTVVAWTGILSLFACILASVVSIVVRFRRSRGDERQQVKWFASAVVS